MLFTCRFPRTRRRSAVTYIFGDNETDLRMTTNDGGETGREANALGSLRRRTDGRGKMFKLSGDRNFCVSQP